MKTFEQRKQDAAVQFACDYGPLGNALACVQGAREAVANRLNLFLHENGLSIAAPDPITDAAYIPLKRSRIVPPSEEQLDALARETMKKNVNDHGGAQIDFNTAKSLVRSAMKSDLNAECWASTQYTVLVKRNCEVFADGWPAMDWLSIRRDDRAPVRDWRHMQEIKNQLCGPEREGVELFPAESRLVDQANQYHLWVTRDGDGIKNFAWPFGFFNGRQVLDSISEATNAKQRPR